MDRQSRWTKQAFLEGEKVGSQIEAALGTSAEMFQSVQQSFSTWCFTEFKERPNYLLMKKLSSAYCRGVGNSTGKKVQGIPLALRGSAAAVVCASNEEKSLHLVLNELERLPLMNIIVILNGCQDHSFNVARRHKGTTIVHYDQRLGHDVGRSIGAGIVKDDIVLFTDGDIVIPAEELAPFLYEVDGGVDVALNHITPYLPSFNYHDEVTRNKSFLNMILQRQELHADSLTAVPHALSSRCISGIGLASLMVPPKAQAIALAQGYRVASVHSVDVISRNRSHTSNRGKHNVVADMIKGDHAEALYELMSKYGIPLDTPLESRSEVAIRRNSR
ncbi:hypothetical protein J2T13_001626 [Paenibacillus sp. DS2015]